MARRARQLKNHNAEAELFRRRALVGFLGVLLALGGLSAWYFRLQVVQHAEYATRSEANRVRLVPVAPARGLIYDRKGRILADNMAAWRLDAVPERAGDGVALLVALRGSDFDFRLRPFQPPGPVVEDAQARFGKGLDLDPAADAVNADDPADRQ